MSGILITNLIVGGLMVLIYNKVKECIVTGWVVSSIILTIWSYIYIKLLGYILFFTIGFLISLAAIAYLEILTRLSKKFNNPTLCIGVIETIAQLPDMLGPIIASLIWIVNKYFIFYRCISTDNICHFFNSH